MQAIADLSCCMCEARVASNDFYVYRNIQIMCNPLDQRNRSRGIREGGGKKGGRRQPCPVGRNSLGDEGEEMALLETTGGADAEDALDKLVTLSAVSSKTALAPQHRPPQRAFRRVVGRLDPLRP